MKPTYNPNITTNKEERFHPPLLIIILKLKTNSNKLPSFHLSQPFSLSYRSILPTSLTYVMLLNQRLLTLRTWCGYWYDMIWKWYYIHIYFTIYIHFYFQLHIIFHGTKAIHSNWNKIINKYKNFHFYFHSLLFSKGTFIFNFYISFIKAK